jgi:hypothetical protein
VAEAHHGVLREGLQGDAHKRKQVCDGDGAAFLFRPGALLDQRVHRDHKESSGYAEQCEFDEDCQVADVRPGEPRSHQQDAA